MNIGISGHRRSGLINEYIGKLEGEDKRIVRTAVARENGQETIARLIERAQRHRLVPQSVATLDEAIVAINIEIEAAVGYTCDLGLDNLTGIMARGERRTELGCESTLLGGESVKIVAIAIQTDRLYDHLDLGVGIVFGLGMVGTDAKYAVAIALEINVYGVDSHLGNHASDDIALVKWL